MRAADMASARQAAPATDTAAALLGRLVERGVRHIVVSPGSRSQALALVAAELEARGAASVHVRIDERVAGFTALGIGRESGMPAAVVCTSGTAVANLLPAALEAHRHKRFAASVVKATKDAKRFATWLDQGAA